MGGCATKENKPAEDTDGCVFIVSIWQWFLGVSFRIKLIIWVLVLLLFPSPSDPNSIKILLQIWCLLVKDNES